MYICSATHGGRDWASYSAQICFQNKAMLHYSVSLGPSFTKVKQPQYVKFQLPPLCEKQTLHPHMFQAQI